mmetsp:Transcript_5784/g.16547  ORF Transcript_5784/g.16547 Transcript_5784/m.16547 type:complete len:388 (+) Transcript_5784:199-1362(+)
MKLPKFFRVKKKKTAAIGSGSPAVAPLRNGTAAFPAHALPQPPQGASQAACSSRDTAAQSSQYQLTSSLDDPEASRSARPYPAWGEEGGVRYGCCGELGRELRPEDISHAPAVSPGPTVPLCCPYCGDRMPEGVAQCDSCTCKLMLREDADGNDFAIHCMLEAWAEAHAPAQRAASTGHCGICMDDDVPLESMFTIDECGHHFCRPCLQSHVNMAVSDKVIPRCPEPQCRSKPLARHWEEVLSADEFSNLAQLATQMAVDSTPGRLYCPHSDCSAPLLGPEEVLTDEHTLECPHCTRPLCPLCRGKLHPGMDCAAYMNDVDDAPVRELATKEEWQHCPGCRVIVSRIDGCRMITCRCGIKFCYRCGKEYTAEAAKKHRCSYCCKIWE